MSFWVSASYAKVNKRVKKGLFAFFTFLHLSSKLLHFCQFLHFSSFSPKFWNITSMDRCGRSRTGCSSWRRRRWSFRVSSLATKCCRCWNVWLAWLHIWLQLVNISSLTSYALPYLLLEEALWFDSQISHLLLHLPSKVPIVILSYMVEIAYIFQDTELIALRHTLSGPFNRSNFASWKSFGS